MDPIESEPYEFLDLSDVNDSERNEIINTLTSDQTAQLNEVAGNHRAAGAGASSRTSPRLLSVDDASIVHLNQRELQSPNHNHHHHQQQQQNQQQTDVIQLNRNAPNENILPINGLTFSSSNKISSSTLSDSFECSSASLGSSSLDKRSTVSSKKSSNNDANAQMSLPLPAVSNLTATAIESSLSVIDSNGNLVKVQHLQKAEKTQYGHVVRNLMLPRLIAPLSLPLYAVVKPTTAKLTELAVVPLRAPIIPASAAVKSHADQQGKVRINVKSCGTSNLKLANVTMAQHTQPVVHQSPPQQQQQQQQQQQPQQPPPPQQQQQQVPASQQSQQHQQPPAPVPPSAQQQPTPQQQGQQQQQIASTSASAVTQQNSSYPHHGGSAQPVYNQMHPGNIYVSAHGVQPVGGPMYPAMIPAGIPPNVYVNNVTANVNLHGWAAHSVPAYIQGGPQHYMPGEVQPGLVDQSNQVMQTMQPVAVTSSNTGRSVRRGRGRNNNNNNRRNDYVQRQQQESPAPQDMVNAQSVDPQAMANAYPPYGYQYNYPTYYGGPPQNHMVHPQAQQAAGPPLYVSPIPVYPGPQIYNYHPSVIYQPMMHPAEYQFDENSDDQRSNDGMMPQMWHQPMYADEYVNPELIAPEDMNHNAPSLASSETPSMLSPNYQIYDPQMQQSLELQQQMSVMHIYDEQQMQPHPGHMQQIEDEMSECALQQMQGVAIMQPIMQPMDPQQPHHHSIQNQGISIDASNLDQSGGSDHSLHEQHMPNNNNNNNEAVIDGSIVEQGTDQQTQQIPQQSVPAGNYHHKGHHQQQHPPQPLHIQQYGPNQVPNAVTKDNTRDSNQNVPNVTNQQHHSNARNQPKEHINMHNSYNSQSDEHPSHTPHQQQQQQHQPPPPQQQQQQPLQSQQHHQTQHLQQHHPLQHQQYQQHHRNAGQQQHQQQQQQHPQNTTVPGSSNVHNNDTSSQQNTAPMVNKTMSWTNSHTKKSTASVAVTATPTSTHKQYNQMKSSSTYLSNSNHHHSAQQQPQVKNYGVMKTPSSPVANSHNSISSTVLPTSTSTTTTVPPPQGNVPSERKYSGPVAGEHKASVSTTSIASTVVPQQFQPQLVTDATKPPTPSQSVKKTEVLNLAPPITSNASNTGSSSSSQSWASLFASANTTNFTTSVASSSAPFSAKKPIAKVAPYEGITTAPPAPPVVPPGGMSYSAASAQGLPQPAVNQAGASKQKISQDAGAPTAARNSNIDEWSYQFAEFLTKHKTNFSPVSLRPRGLTNPSNYCYINSILQALMGCAPFYNLIKSIPKQLAALSSEVKTPTINAMLQFTSEFSSLPSGLRLNRPQKQVKGKDDMGSDLHCDPAFEPTAIYKLWNDSREEHVEGRQEDAEEFLGYVLNKLNDEMLEVIKLIAKPTVEQNGGEQTSESEEGAVWQMIRNNRNKGSITRQTDFGRTPLSDIFRGELRSRLQREGEHSTDVIQPFFTLQLNIEKAASVKEALEILVGRDQLEGVTGSKSKQEVVAWQQMHLEKLPVVLILHLKWFDYKSDGCTKILKTVEFPVELKIDPKILASKKYSQKQRIYRLFAVVYHDGKEASKGHYITDVYHTGYSSWLRFDDSTVKPVSEHNVLRPRVPRVPYLLYYRRCDTMPNLPQTTTTTLQTNANSNK